MLDLKELAQGVPAHVINDGFRLGNNPVGGDWFLYSDDGKGMGRQHIATIPAGKDYFGTLAQYMAAAHPATILSLYARLEAAERGTEDAIREAEKRGRKEGAWAARRAAVEAAWLVVKEESCFEIRKGAYRAAQAVAAATG